uniref:Uncharacterized protein n=1 Tax=Tetraselmis sp. GSL018 TaxID=582737 RepID=A0A061SFK9_9CHLO
MICEHGLKQNQQVPKSRPLRTSNQDTIVQPPYPALQWQLTTCPTLVTPKVAGVVPRCWCTKRPRTFLGALPECEKL